MLTALLKKNLSPDHVSQLRQWYQGVHSFTLPAIPGVHALLYGLHRTLSATGQALLQKLYYTPLFLSRVANRPRRLQLYSGMPLLCGQLRIELGEGCRISGATTFSGRNSSERPTLVIGDNVDINWQSTIAVGEQVILEDNVRLAGRVFLAGYPGHPVDPLRRARGEPDDAHQVGSIHLKENVWVGTGSTILQGVTIGENSIVATGSVVTKSMPANVLIGGNPARVIKPLEVQP
ncbi:acyltransferase [Photobacterium atrarenae]|uniref:acyltransferase n=1 Tax=Photobacterium atrarenae TaxID=865757 RepID=UPI0026F390FE|nr:acyltransferase [Photobacterium atrarenae]